MTRKEFARISHQESALLSLGFTSTEAEQLRRISMTLHRWYEQECGDSNDYGSWAIERDDNGDGPPFMVHHHYRHGRGKDTVTRTRIADREKGAIKRLKGIVAARNARYLNDSKDWNAEHDAPTLTGVAYYLQTDPRGASLYIIRPGDVPDGADVGSYYSRGIVVY